MCRMPIEALPQTTIRAIGSTSVISDAYSVVKELVDNALDASASSLHIEISHNTVDVIQLKDNGTGISPDDQKRVCKRAFTSKIQTLEDLKNVGGSSLGFRGEALASVAEMSGAISVTTRVTEEVVGLCLKYGRDGEISGTQRTSHPVGTTVRITDFLKHLPVRRQTALKSAGKTLVRIRTLLQSYAISQPSKKLSLKVLKASNTKSDWLYAPGSDPSLQDAVLKVAGREVSSSCILRGLSSQRVNENESRSVERKTYEVVAFLPNTQFDVAKINNVGQYISVDGRPLSNRRGIGQEISKIFKSYILSSAVEASKQEIPKSISDPFLALHISCPRGTYDVNIEPAKDDIMFEDRVLVLKLVSDLFRDHYGELDGGGKSALKQNKIIAHPFQVSDGFDLLMAKKPASKSSNQSPQNLSSSNIPNTPLSQKCLTSAHQTPNRDYRRADLGDVPDVSNHTEPNRLGFTNPGSIPTINHCLQTPRRERIPLVTSAPENMPNGSPNIQTQRQHETPMVQSSLDSSRFICTPRLTPGSPARPSQQQPPNSMDLSLRSYRTPSSQRRERKRDREKYGNGALDTWFQRITQSSIQQTPYEEIVPVQESNEWPLSSLTQERFGIPLRSSQEIGDAGEKNETRPRLSPKGTSPRQSSQNETFAPNDEIAQIPMSMDSGRGFPVLERWAAQLHGDDSSERPTDLEKALDFEKRKKDAIQIRRMKLTNANKSSSSQLPPVLHSSQNSRYLAAKAALTSSQTSVTESVPATKLPPHDPRWYLMRQNELNLVGEVSENNPNPKVRSLRAGRLPLERIPDGFDLHDLSITYPANPSSKYEVFKHYIHEDMYLENGDEAAAFSPYTVDTCVPLWNQRLDLLIQEQYESKDNSRLQSLKIDISSIISDHLKTFDGR